MPEWEYVPEGWARGDAHIRGWSVDSVLDAYRAKLPAFREALVGTGPIATATSAAVPAAEPSVHEQNAVLAFAYALSLASRRRDRISVLDWGGGLGYFSYLARALLPDDVEIEYHCKDTPNVCRYGRDALPEIRFWDDETCLDRHYDFVFASSSLQYSEAWSDLVERLGQASRGYLFLTRVPVVFRSASFVVLQRTYGDRFQTEYLSWVFNEQELLAAAARSGVALVREFLMHGGPRIVGAPEQEARRAYLFRAHGR